MNDAELLISSVPPGKWPSCAACSGPCLLWGFRGDSITFRCRHEGCEKEIEVGVGPERMTELLLLVLEKNDAAVLTRGSFKGGLMQDGSWSALDP